MVVMSKAAIGAPAAKRSHHKKAPALPEPPAAGRLLRWEVALAAGPGAPPAPPPGAGEGSGGGGEARSGMAATRDSFATFAAWLEGASAQAARRERAEAGRGFLCVGGFHEPPSCH